MRVFAGRTKHRNSQVHAFEAVNAAAGLSYKAFCGSTVFLSAEGEAPPEYRDITCPWCRQAIKKGLVPAIQEQIERHHKAHAAAREKAKNEGIYVYCPGDPPSSVGLLGLVYGPSGEVAALPPSGAGESDFLRLIELADEAITARRLGAFDHEVQP